jgi:hypothetical protein
LQNLIYERKLAGETLGQLSQAFGISKARIEAVMKLKDVEMQFKRQVSLSSFLFQCLCWTHRINDERYLT